MTCVFKNSKSKFLCLNPILCHKKNLAIYKFQVNFYTIPNHIPKPAINPTPVILFSKTSSVGWQSFLNKY